MTQEVQTVHFGDQKHPKTKKVVMLGAAATVTYMWTQMTFVGEPEYDFDLSGVAGAAAGTRAGAP